MASSFKNTLSGLKNVLTGGVGKRLPQNIQNKLAGTAGEVNPKKELHLSSKQFYPAAEPLPMPINIDPTESTRFSPQRARDVSSAAIATSLWNTKIDITNDQSVYQANVDQPSYDPHVASYDCRGAISLSSSMQSNVPTPFGGTHKFSHLNMPGGQWEQSSKWASHDLHSSHYTTLRREARKKWSNGVSSSTKQTANDADKVD